MTNLSVVVCTYNRVDYLIRALEHLRDQKGVSSDDYEVVVVNNNSPDDTESSVIQFLADNGLDGKWTYVLEKNQGHTYSRNRGIQESSGKLISFIDDDAYVRKGYCRAIIDFFQSHPNVSAIGGKIIPLYESKEPRWMTKYLLPLVAALDMGPTPKKFKHGKFPIGANMAYCADVFENYGLFNVELGRRGEGLEGGDEKDLIYRLRQGNELIYYSPDVCVDHVIPEKRTQNEYIRGLAIGVGTSEKKRLKTLPKAATFRKVIDESVKVTGTLVLALLYYIRLEFDKANMLIKFRLWVIKGYLS